MGRRSKSRVGEDERWGAPFIHNYCAYHEFGTVAAAVSGCGSEVEGKTSVSVEMLQLKCHLRLNFP